ncbi:unnamed protein product [Caenorhabditis auriculariae]|uniref:Uncharacterized protein n=1 Tax=Caenorhabditis auriculariae TaxID=2777116 RepID=A0A8S1HKL9_9PELO|nr:unnamed protein product [Caenorhabditis auriculariae]
MHGKGNRENGKPRRLSGNFVHNSKENWPRGETRDYRIRDSRALNELNSNHTVHEGGSFLSQEQRRNKYYAVTSSTDKTMKPQGPQEVLCSDNARMKSATGCVPVYGPQGHKFDPRPDPTKGFKKCWWWETRTSKSPAVTHKDGYVTRASPLIIRIGPRLIDLGRRRRSSVEEPASRDLIEFTMNLTESFDIEEMLESRNHDKVTCGFLTAVNPTYRILRGFDLPNSSTKEKMLDYLRKLECSALKLTWPFVSGSFENIICEKLFKDFCDIISSCFAVKCAKKGCFSKTNSSAECFLYSVLMRIDPSKELVFFRDLLLNCINEAEPFWFKFREQEKEKCPHEQCRRILVDAVEALESGDEALMFKHQIMNFLRSLADRRNFGYNVSASDVEKMLLENMKLSGFGDFLVTAREAVDLFSTKRHLDLVFAELPRVAGVTDMRVKQMIKKMIVCTLKRLSGDDKEEVVQQHLGKQIIGNHICSDFARFASAGNTDMSFFCAALDLEFHPEMQFEEEDMEHVILYYYLLFPMRDVNARMFEFFANNDLRQSQRILAAKAMKNLPNGLKSRLERKTFETRKVETATENVECSFYETMRQKMFEDRDFAANFSRSTEVMFRAELIDLNTALSVLTREVEQAGPGRSVAANAIHCLLGRNFFQIFLANHSSTILDLLKTGLWQYEPPVDCLKSNKYNFIEKLLRKLDEEVCKRNIALDYEATNKIFNEWEQQPVAKMYILMAFLSKSLLHRIDLVMPWGKGRSNLDGKTGEPKYELIVDMLAVWPNEENSSVLEEAIEMWVPKSVDRKSLIKEMRNLLQDMPYSEALRKQVEELVDDLTEVYDRRNGENEKVCISSEPSNLPETSDENETGTVEKNKQVEKETHVGSTVSQFLEDVGIRHNTSVMPSDADVSTSPPSEKNENNIGESILDILLSKSLAEEQRSKDEKKEDFPTKNGADDVKEDVETGDDCPGGVTEEEPKQRDIIESESGGTAPEFANHREEDPEQSIKSENETEKSENLLEADPERSFHTIHKPDGKNRKSENRSSKYDQLPAHNKSRSKSKKKRH